MDNVLGMPTVQRPLDLGADVVVYSTTKHIDGQGRCLGGAILGSDAYFADDLVPFIRTTGPVMSPFNAWVMLKGLETLELRTARMCETAERLAAFLEGHPAVAAVHYPGLASHPQHALAARQMSRGGSVIAFDLAGGWDAAFRFLDALALIDISNNLGRCQEPRHPPRQHHASEDRRGTPGRRLVSPTAWSASRSGWRRRPTCARISSRRLPRREAESRLQPIFCGAARGAGLGCRQ